MQYILALDQGTTSSRALIIDNQGMVISMAQQPIPLITPQPNWVEQCPIQLWESQLKTAILALQQAQLSANNISCIGIANQRETTLIWHKSTGKPIANAIVWQDSRTYSHCQSLQQQGYESIVSAQTGLRLAPYFSATKIQWLLDNTPNARTQAAAGELAFGTVDSWLLWQLTQGKIHSIEASNASRTLLMNLHTQQWDKQLLDLFNIPMSILPTISHSAGALGVTTLFGSPIAITGILGDQQAALLGQGCLQRGQAKTTYGTGCSMLANTDTIRQPSQHKLLSTLAWSIPASISSDGQFVTQYALEGSVFMGGAIIQWLRDNLGIISRAADIQALASSVNDSEGVYMIPAFTGLGAPYWNNNIGASIQGLSRGSHKGHIARAALEAIAYQVTDLVYAIQEDMGQNLVGLQVDGGAAECPLLLQIQANCIGLPLHRPNNAESTALGAAIIAGIGSGLFTTRDQLQPLFASSTTIHPSANRKQAVQYHAWHTAIQTALKQSPSP